MNIRHVWDAFKESLNISSFPRRRESSLTTLNSRLRGNDGVLGLRGNGGVSGFCLMILLAGFVHSTLAQEANPSAGINYTNSSFVLPPDVERMLSVDLNADTYPDFLALQKETITVYLQQLNGSFDFNTPSASIPLQGAGMGWDVVNYRVRGAEQPQPRLMALVDGRRIVTWDFVDATLSEPVVILDNLTGFLPKGLFQMRFARDINEDGSMDFIVPGAEELHLHLQNPAGDFQDAITVQSFQFGETDLMNGDLQRGVGQSLSIPLMQLRDLNNDGFNDLISRSEERIDVFYSQTGSAAPTFAATPIYSVDLTALQAGFESFSLDQVDFSNLTSLLALTFDVWMNDVNNDGFDDVVIREGGKISLFTSSATGIDFEAPQQVLRSSGNVLGSYIRDENGDGLEDLWLARVESISIGDVFVWLALSGTLDVEVFIYRNEGTQFTRRPSRKLTLAVKYPSALSLLSTGLEVEGTMSAARDSRASPSVMSNMNQNSLDEMVVLMNDRLEVFFDLKEPKEPRVETFEEMEERVEQSILGFLGYRPEMDSYEVDIRKIIDELMAQAGASNDLTAGRTADMQLALGTTTDNGDVFAMDLNKDGVDDFVVFVDGDEERINGMLFVSDKD
jgi:hypothetical protein